MARETNHEEPLMGTSLAGADPADVLVAFANTLDVEDGADALERPRDVVRFLSEHGLLDRRAAAAPADLESALSLRTALRAQMAAHHDQAGVDDETWGRVAAALPLTLQLTATGPRLRPRQEGVPGGLAALLALVVEADAQGDWVRLKICPADDCRWAFYDSSKNRSRTWCSMQVCGNRTKSRVYRNRRSSTTVSGPPATTGAPPRPPTAPRMMRP